MLGEMDAEFELLCCAMQPALAALPRWERLLQQCPAESLSPRARRLLPAVAKNLLAVKPSRADLLDEVYHTTLEQNLKLRQGCAEVVRLFEAAGLEVMVFKGVLLCHAVHRDLGVRPAHDFDLLVRLSQARQACQLLREAGWLPVDSSIDPLERLENAADFRRDGLKLDLHWSLLREARHEGADHELWQSRRRCDFETFQADALSPTHQLFHLLAVTHREPHHLRRYLYDLWAMRQFGREPYDLVQAHRMLKQRRLLYRARSIPLELVGAQAWRPTERPALLDCLWSTVSRHRHDRWGDWNYLLFPLFDYALHFGGGQPPGWTASAYLARRYKLDEPLWGRVRRKLARLVGL